MSAGIYAPQRYDSSLINTPDYYAQQAAAQQGAYQQQIAAIPTPQSPLDYLAQITWQRATDVANQQGGDVSAIYADLRNQSDQALAQNGTSGRNPAYYLYPILGNQAVQYQDYVGAQQNGMPSGYGNPGAYGADMAGYNAQTNAISAQAQAAAAKAKAEADARANNQATQQQAYNQQTGGGFNGGILNSSYAKPFGNTITGTADTTGTTGFNGGMMGAASVAAPSTGLTPTGPAAGMVGTGFGAPAGLQAPSGASAWGGPFSNKNPWSLG